MKTSGSQIEVVDRQVMVKNGHVVANGIPSVEYRPATPGRVLEIFDTDSLLDRVGIEALAVHRRLAFHFVQLTLQEGHHDVDFSPVRLQAGALMHLRPGQVHRWLPDSNRAVIVVFPDGPWVEPFGPPGSSAPVLIADDEVRTLRATLDFARQRLSADPSPLVVAGLRDLVIAEVAAGRRPVRVGPAAYLALVDRLEAGEFGRSISAHASALGYSERTITRACQEAVGMTAKELVDQRVALEARRRLTDEDATVGGVGRSLGFSEATNFVKFFRRVVKMTPAEWQAGLRSGSA